MFYTLTGVLFLMSILSGFLFILRHFLSDSFIYGVTFHQLLLSFEKFVIDDPRVFNVTLVDNDSDGDLKGFWVRGQYLQKLIESFPILDLKNFEVLSNCIELITILSKLDFGHFFDNDPIIKMPDIGCLGFDNFSESKSTNFWDIMHFGDGICEWIVPVNEIVLVVFVQYFHYFVLVLWELVITELFEFFLWFLWFFGCLCVERFVRLNCCCLRQWDFCMKMCHFLDSFTTPLHWFLKMYIKKLNYF